VIFGNDDNHFTRSKTNFARERTRCTKYTRCGVCAESETCIPPVTVVGASNLLEHSTVPVPSGLGRPRSPLPVYHALGRDRAAVGATVITSMGLSRDRIRRNPTAQFGQMKRLDVLGNSSTLLRVYCIAFITLLHISHTFCDYYYYYFF